MKAVLEPPNYSKMAEIVEVGVSFCLRENMNKGSNLQRTKYLNRWRIYK
jgi:hypothetical protein